MTALCCGLDIGSTNLKAVLVDETGRVRWARAVTTPRIDDGVGVATSAADLLTAAEDLIVEGWRDVGGGVPLRAIATAGVGEDGLPVDANLQPAAPSVPWFDERAAGEAEELEASEAASRQLGLRVDRFRSVAKWLWFSRHRPGDLGAQNLWVALTDFPSISWSGRPFMSETLATRTAAYDVYRRRWHPAMIRAAKAPALPPVVAAAAVLGTVRPGRLREAGVADAETLVVAGGHDHPVAASFIRRFEPQAIVDSMGTAEVVYGETADTDLRPLDPRLAFSVPVLGGPGLSCLGVLELAATLAPYRESPHGDLVSEFLVQGSSGGTSPETPPEGVDTAPLSSLSRQAAIASTKNAIRAVIGRSAALVNAIGATGDIYTTGGWSRSNRFLQMRAESFGRPIFRFDEDELTGAGAGLIAWSARSPLDPTQLTRPNVRRFDPSRTVALEGDVSLQDNEGTKPWQ